jgi:FlaA1/EpsC-like NDP-sugar epimerase
MGEPVKIVDLAQDLIRLSGLEVGRDIDILFTGLRPGEKLTEQLYADGELAQPTAHPKIMVVRPNGMVAQDRARLQARLEELGQAAQSQDDRAVYGCLVELLPAAQLAPSTTPILPGFPD